MRLRLALLLSAVTLSVAGVGGFAAQAAAAAPTSAWVWPLPAPHRVVHGFDPPDQPWLPGHRGVDLAGSAGEPVLAAGAGVVAFAGRVAGVPVVSIRHVGGLLTTYEPVFAGVSRGDEVAAGERIGRLVRTGSHCAPDVCLHWGLRRGVDYLDPLSLVEGVRLLPIYAGGDTSWPVPLAGGAAVASASVLLGRRRLRCGRRRAPW